MFGWKNRTTFHLFVINKQAKDNLLVELPFFRKNLIPDGKKVFGGIAAATLGYINTICVCLQKNISKLFPPPSMSCLIQQELHGDD